MGGPWPTDQRGQARLEGCGLRYASSTVVVVASTAVAVLRIPSTKNDEQDQDDA
jgi:hypothetical protein